MNRTFWDINYLVGRKQMETLAWGLLTCHGQLLDSFRHTNHLRPTFSIRISLPADQVDMFKTVTRIELHPPFKPDV